MEKKDRELLHQPGVRTNATTCFLIVFFILFIWSDRAGAATWYVSAEKGSDSDAGTEKSPVRSVKKAFSLAKAGDVIIFSAGLYPCAGESSSDGQPGSWITINSAGDGKVIFSGDGSGNLIQPGSYTIIRGIEFTMTDDHPDGAGISIQNKGNIDINNCRFFACEKGIDAVNSHHISIENCEMAFSGTYGVHLHGSGDGPAGHWDPAEECAWIEVRNCWIHDSGWNIEGTEGYGITSNGAVEYLVIENCQFDNNSGDGILYEDWGIHTTARYNVIRGSGIAGIWIDNASMSIFDNNFLYANNVAVWMSGEESSNRFLSDMVSIRNNIIVHNDWSAIDTSVYGKVIILFTSNTRDLYFDNNTVAFNNCESVVGFQMRPPLNEFSNIWFRNNIFWHNTGGVGIPAGIGSKNIHFLNNLWTEEYPDDSLSHTGDPAFANPMSASPEGYRLKDGSAATDAGMLIHENQVDFWNGQRPHLPGQGAYDIGASESGTTGAALIGLDLNTFPFSVTPYKLQFKAKPAREKQNK